MERDENYWKQRRFSRRQVIKGGTKLGVGIVGLAIGGCGTSTPSATPTVKSAQTTASGAGTTPAASPKPAAKKPTGTITIGIGSDIENMDLQSGAGGNFGAVSILMGEILWGRNHFTGESEGILATSYKMSPDGLAYDFELRKGVKFHSGDPFTASDVKFSFERAMDPDTKNVRSAALKPIDRFEIIDDSHVKMVLKQFVPTILDDLNLLIIVPEKHIKKVGTDAVKKNPVSTGPYKFVERQIGESIKFEAFDDYWGTLPQVKSVVIKIIPDAMTRIAMLKTGGLDFAQGIPPDLMDDINKTSGIKAQVSKYGTVWNYITIDVDNSQYPWMTDKRVRQALNYAIDKSTIIKEILKGTAEEVAGTILPTSVGYDPNLKPYPYDPAKAKALLAEAGFPQIEAVLNYPMGRFLKGEEVMEAISSYWTKVGIKTTTQGWEYSKWGTKIYAHEFPLTLTSYLAAWDPTTNWPFIAMSGSKLAYWTDPQFDKWWAEAQATVEAKKRDEQIKTMHKYLYDQAGMVFLWNQKDVWGITNKVTYDLGVFQPQIRAQVVKWA